MRKILLIFALVLFQIPYVLADEGMWIPMLIGKNYEQMKALGFKLTPEDIYNVNGSSLKDAIVRFGGGCTAEVISPDGLLITNHHCGFSSIQAHSSVDHDYLTDGFWAMTRDQELPNEGLTVRFLQRMEDVSDVVLKGIVVDTPEGDRQKLIAQRADSIEVANTNKGNGIVADVRSFYYGNQYFLMVYEEFSDVRLVGAPPESIGKFGGDTDNWVWPRHTGDFSIFRIYASKDNKPASYSPDNVPYKSKRFLKISLKGVHENDFTMVYGFPGRTQQFLVSDAVKLLINQSNPNKINLRGTRLDIFNKYMNSNDTIRIQYASKYASVANYWKKWIGETIGLRRLNAIEKKQEQESMFEAWVNTNKDLKEKYGNLLPSFRRLYAEVAPLSLVADFRNEDVYAVELLRFSSNFSKYINDVISGKGDSATIETERKDLVRYTSSFFKNFNINIDYEVFGAMMYNYHQKIPLDYQPEFLKNIQEQYGDKWMQMASDIYNQTAFADSLRVLTLLASSDTANVKVFLNDPVFQIYSQFENLYRQKVKPRYYEIEDSLDIFYRRYVEGLMKMQPDKEFFPDANSTLRVTYGTVKGFEPRDGVVYDYYTTLDGVIEKSMNKNVADYVAPKRLIDLYKSKDYGIYGVNGTVPVAFIATNHTTGGNSGSPVLDGEGNLIGVNFDRCWESTMSDVMFDPDYCRNIALDIRYALFIIDKYAGAKNLISEMEIVE